MKTTDKLHFLQSDEWASVKAKTPWKPKEIILSNNDRIKLYRRLTPGGSVQYVPGFNPTSPEDIAVLTKCIKRTKGVQLVTKVEPCAPYDQRVIDWFIQSGWVIANNAQYAHTVVIDLTKTEDRLLNEMKSRARRDVNLSARRGVVVESIEPTDDNLRIMYQLLKTTSRRKKFNVRDKDFIMAFWKEFRKTNRLKVYFAKHELDLLAGAVVIHNGQTAWYKEGASMTHKSNLCAPRLLLWEIAKDLKKSGIEAFDLSGVPDPSTYENSKMKGLYIFKSGYTQEATNMMPAFELPHYDLTYKAWPVAEKGIIKAYQAFSKIWY